MSRQKKMKTSKLVAPSLRLRRLHVQNWRCFADATIDFMRGSSPRGQSMVVGRNGAGKTSLLRALAIAMCQQREASALMGELVGDSVRRNKSGNYADHAEISLEFYDPAAPDSKIETVTRVDRDPSGQEVLHKQTEPANFPWDRIFVGGFGVNRGARHREARSGYSRLESLRSLFSDDTSLLDPEATLRAIKLADIENGHKGLLSATIKQLRQILLLNPNHKIEVSAQSVLVHGPWGTMPFHALGDGYRGTAGWLLDLLGSALVANRLSDVEDLCGIVLIDEIDEHLHPSWQRKLLGMLSRRFEYLQIVGTTHSPMTIVDCDSDQLIACDLRNAVASVYQNLDDPRGHTADEILRGEWFGLASTLDSKSEKLLKKYQRAVERREPEARVEVVREQLRERLGRRFDSPIDELAIEIAAEVRQQFRQDATEKDRRKLVSAAARRLRRRIKQSGYRRGSK